MSDRLKIEQEFSEIMERTALEDKEEWRQWVDRIPFIELPAGWKVKPIPPYFHAIARMRVESPAGNGYSIYLDTGNKLGYFDNEGSPYWEVYPIEDDVARFAMEDVVGLVECMVEAEGRS